MAGIPHHGFVHTFASSVAFTAQTGACVDKESERSFYSSKDSFVS